MDPISLICAVKPGETININTSEIVIHRSYYASFSRWWNCEDGIKLVIWVYNNITPLLKGTISRSERSMLISIVCGVRNLAVTYVGRNIGSYLANIANIIERRLNNAHNFSIPTINVQPDGISFVYIH